MVVHSFVCTPPVLGQWFLGSCARAKGELPAPGLPTVAVGRSLEHLAILDDVQLSSQQPQLTDLLLGVLTASWVAAVGCLCPCSITAGPLENHRPSFLCVGECGSVLCSQLAAGVGLRRRSTVSYKCPSQDFLFSPLLHCCEGQPAQGKLLFSLSGAFRHTREPPFALLGGRGGGRGRQALRSQLAVWGTP